MRQVLLSLVMLLLGATGALSFAIYRGWVDPGDVLPDVVAERLPETIAPGRPARQRATALVTAADAEFMARGFVPVKDSRGRDVILYEESHALIVGESNYDNKDAWHPLPGVLRDIVTVRSALETQGFDVEIVQDLTLSLLDETIRSFIARKGQKENARLLFYFAGHGNTESATYGRDMGFFVTKDAEAPGSRAGFASHALSMEAVKVYAQTIAAKHAIFIFDSCFSGSIFRGAEDNGPPPAVSARAGRPVRYFITAGTKDQVVPDKSIFRAQFIAALEGDGDLNRDGYVTGPELGSFLEDTVSSEAERNGKKQTPFFGPMEDSLFNKGDLIFPVVQAAPPGGTKKPGDAFRDCVECPLMVVVPAGKFIMGSPDTEERRYDNEGPQHEVTIAKDFAVGKYEVTFLEWDGCVAAGGCGGYRPDDEGWGRGGQPVIDVSWKDAQDYVDWLKRKTGKAYRLLSEAEWEYSVRAGTTTPFSFGRTISTDQANYNGSYTYGSGQRGTYRAKTMAVGSLPANGFGLHDMHGNVWEWVEDCWNESYGGAPSDGRAWQSGDCAKRVLRGGSWVYFPRNLRSANRDWFGTGFHVNSFGFRVARTL